jgi:hypothetical protein
MTTRLVVHSELQRVSAVRKLAPASENIEELSHFGRYFAVVACGLLEKLVRKIFEDFAACNARPEVASYVGQRIKRYSDVGSAELVAFVSAFSTEWGERLRLFLDGEHGDALDSLKNVRNNVAHGENVGISLGSVDRYYQSVVATVEFLDTLAQ